MNWQENIYSLIKEVAYGIKFNSLFIFKELFRVKPDMWIARLNCNQFLMGKY